ncbi:EamA family transporter [Candidatus Peregrinibacteria bacterium]|jgi:multidrug transporter EmrE-like cation transporter|nr:EamA family transporter [Candidatus Peregrinibacteria bacterium]MBT7703663.1 EamA family transporter [Candidatus Peregrinibacteria bacterium]
MTLSLVFLGLAIMFTVLGQFFYKKYFLTKNITLVGISLFCFVLVPYCSYRALINLPIDVVYVSTALSIILAVALAVIFLKEKLTKQEVYGMAAIIVGILLYNFGAFI